MNIKNWKIIWIIFLLVLMIGATQEQEPKKEFLAGLGITGILVALVMIWLVWSTTKSIGFGILIGGGLVLFLLMSGFI